MEKNQGGIDGERKLILSFLTQEACPVRKVGSILAILYFAINSV